MIPHLATHVPRAFSRHFPDLLWRIPSDAKAAYLTFDDGPTTVLTQDILNLLERFQAGATFFLIGAHAERHPALVQAIHEAGHTIGNHTFSHPDAWLTPTSRVIAELERTTTVLEELIQTPLRLMRPPYGRFTRPMRLWCQTRRQRLTMWDVMPGDFLPGATTAGLRRHILRCVRPGSIIVLHDNPKARLAMPAALEAVLQTLTDQGWQFRAL